MFIFKRLGFTRYESLLGAGIIAIAVLVFLPTIKSNISGIIWDKSDISTVTETETFARSIRQFHDETGQWPAFYEKTSHATGLLGTLAKRTPTKETGTGLFDEKPMPLDQWDNPFLVRYIETSLDDVDESTKIVILSKGPNGILDTAITDLWYQDITRRLMNSGSDQAQIQGELFGGDDVGFVLSRLDLGSDD